MAGQGFDPDEDRTGAVTDVLGVFFAVPARCCGDRVACIGEELVGLLVGAHHRARRIIGALVDIEDVFHPGDELPVRLRRDSPAPLQVRTKFRFFNTRPMVE